MMPKIMLAPTDKSLNGEQQGKSKHVSPVCLVKWHSGKHTGKVIGSLIDLNDKPITV